MPKFLVLLRLFSDSKDALNFIMLLDILARALKLIILIFKLGNTKLAAFKLQSPLPVILLILPETL